MLALGLAASDTTARVPLSEPPRAVAQAPDPWIGADKVKHATFAFALQGGAYAAMRGATDHRLALAGATVATGVVSLLKERMDRRTTGFSARDLAWDAVGIVAASVLLASVPHR